MESENSRRWDVRWQEGGHLHAVLKLMGTSQAHRGIGENPLDIPLDFALPLHTSLLDIALTQSGVEPHCSNMWRGRAQGGVAELGPFGNDQGVICQTVAASHYSFQSRKQIDKSAVNHWKMCSDTTVSKKRMS